MTVWRTAARLGAVLACVLAGTAAFGASPAAAARGVTVEITEVSGRFEAGAEPKMTVVASKRTGGNCLKVRWSMLLRVEDMSLDQVDVDRVEADGPFAVDRRTEGDSARVIDQELDPGRLCRNNNVTARYELELAEDVPDGRMTLVVEARDADGDLLEDDTVTRNVAGNGEATPSAEPTDEASEQAEIPITGGGVGQAVDPTSASGGSGGLLPIGLAVGGMMVFLGMTLLIRARKRLRVKPVRRPGYGGAWQGSAPTRRQRR
jgi:hypothetical protein